MKKNLIPFMIVVLLLLGCSGISLPFSLSTPTVTPTAALLSTATGQAIEDVPGIFCPTENTDAAHAYSLGLASLRQDDWAGAEPFFLQALESDPEFCDAMDSLGGISVHDNDYFAAVTWYERSLAVNPDNLMAVLNLGYSYYYTGRTEEAIAQFEDLTNANPNNPEGPYALGMIYVETNQPEKAIPYLERAAELYAADDSIQAYLLDTNYLLGAAYYELNECAEATSYIEPLVTNNAYYDQHPGANYILGFCYYYDPSLQDLDLAKQYLQRADALGYPLSTELKEFIQ